jgi:hypothetical protein
MNDLKFKRQFICLNKELKIPENWKKISFYHKAIDWNLYHHPDLTVSMEDNGLFQIILIGYILDPYNPTYDDAGVLKDLLQCGSFEQITSKTDIYNGRFVIIYKDEHDLKVLNDVTGFREVYYYFKENLKAFGSTPNILANYLHLSKTTNNDMLSFYHSDVLAGNDYTWVGYDTLYENVKMLPPNHFLNLCDRIVTRFWPREPLKKISLKDAAGICATILKGTIESAVMRYHLHAGLTAGWDTRLLLSATKEFKDKIFYYTNKRSLNKTAMRDLKIPDRLSKYLGINLHYIDIDESVDQAFKDIFKSNNILSRDKLLPVFYNVYQRGWMNTVTVSGTMGNGLARVYMRVPKGYEITGENVARLSNYENQAYAVQSLNQWVQGALPLCNAYNIDIMDLFQLEQDNAHWATLASSEQDIVREEIRIFNNRNLLKHFWSLDDKYRYQYNPAIYTEIMKILWKEVLDVPINPSFRTNLYKILRFFYIEKLIYTYYKKKKFVEPFKKKPDI